MKVQDENSPSSAIAALKRFYAAEERYIATGGHDFVPVAETLDPEIVLRQPRALPYGGEWRGHDGFERWLQAMSEAWSSAAAQDPRFIEHGDTVVVLVTMEARARVTQRRIQTPVCHVVTAREGLLSEWRVFYWDTVAINQTLGHESARG